METSTASAISQDQLREIYDQFDGDLNKIAEHLGLPTDSVPEPISASGMISTPVITRRRQPPADLGQANLRKYVVSIRHSHSPVWPAADIRKIEDARNKYEAGTHEITQGRDGLWFILYLIPRKKRTGPRKFFHME